MFYITYMYPSCQVYITFWSLKCSIMPSDGMDAPIITDLINHVNTVTLYIKASKPSNTEMLGSLPSFLEWFLRSYLKNIQQ